MCSRQRIKDGQGGKPLVFSFRGGALWSARRPNKAKQPKAPFLSRCLQSLKLCLVFTMTLMQSHSENQVMGRNPIFRSESFGHYYPEPNYSMMEKRQLFLRSYQFCRKKSLAERIRGSLVRVKKVVWLKLRSARRLRRLVCSRFKCGFYYRRRRLFRLLNSFNRKSYSYSCLC